MCRHCNSVLYRLLYNIPTGGDGTTAGQADKLETFHRDVFTSGTQRWISAVYLDSFRRQSSQAGLNLGAGDYRQWAMSAADRLTPEYLKESTSSDPPGNTSALALATSLQGGHSMRTHHHDYAGDLQQIADLSRLTLETLETLTCAGWHVLMLPALKKDPQWSRKWKSPARNLSEVSQRAMALLVSRLILALVSRSLFWPSRLHLGMSCHS